MFSTLSRVNSSRFFTVDVTLGNLRNTYIWDKYYRCSINHKRAVAEARMEYATREARLFEDILAEDGLTYADIDAMEDVEIE